MLITQGYAITDADKAIELDRTYLKAYYRRADANMALGRSALGIIFKLYFQKFFQNSYKLHSDVWRSF